MSAAEKPVGPWRLGLRSDDVVADHDTGHDTPDSIAFYGGHLVAESINPPFRSLIAAAPELLEALRELTQNIVFDNEGDLTRPQFDAMLARADAAIAKATGSPL